MRNISFKMWDNVNKIMLYNPIISINPRNGDVICADTENGEFKHGLVLLLFTGLVDKYGNCIYENDIVKFINYEGKECFDLVIWEDCDAGFNLEINDCYLCAMHRTGTMEVVGDIYQNPEILENNNKEYFGN